MRISIDDPLTRGKFLLAGLIFQAVCIAGLVSFDAARKFSSLGEVTGIPIVILTPLLVGALYTSLVFTHPMKIKTPFSRVLIVLICTFMVCALSLFAYGIMNFVFNFAE